MKINTSSIEGFDEMSAEDKLAALLELEVPDEVDLSGYVQKSVFDKKASEAAELSKRLKNRQTDEENAAQAQKEAQEALQKSLDEAKEQIAALTRERNVGKLTAEYIAQGYDQDMAAKAAEALADGDTVKVLKFAAQHMANREQALRAEMLKNTPTPPGSDGDGQVNENVATAAAFGKARAAALQSSNDILSHYISK